MYSNRHEAARALTDRLRPVLAGSEAIVAGVPAGGAVVAARVAMALEMPFACAGVYKVPVATLPDTTLAVIDADGHVTFDPRSELTRYEVQKLGATTLARMHRDLEKCRMDAEEPRIEGATVVVVDEAVLSVLTVRAAATYMRHHGAERVILATPVITVSANAEAERYFGEVVALRTVPDTDDLSRYYSDHRPPDDAEMRGTVHAAYARQGEA